MIVAEQLGKTFDEFVAVHEVSLDVAPGEVLALLGPNGAGKTTTIRMLTAILKPTRGRASVAGFDVVQQPDDVRRMVGVLTEHHGLYTRNQGDEYLDFFGEMYGLTKAVRRQRSAALLERFGLADAAKRRIGEYSKGMRQKLSLIRAMLHDPAALLLDEPTSAMDPESAKQVRDAILELRRDHRTVILSTHNLNEAELLADKIAIIRKGRIVASGSPAELKQRLMGPAEMEVRLAQPLNGVVKDLHGLVMVGDTGEQWLRYTSGQPEVDNPQVLAKLAGLGVPVVTLSEVPRSLESVYLQIMGAEATEEAAR